MSKSAVKMPREIKNRCHKIIHTASAAALAAGAIPIPMSDTIPITAAQIGMIVNIGKVFGLSISQTLAKNLLGCTLAQQAGKAVFTNLIKAIPGGVVAGSIIGAATAASITETLGWLVADDFYRIYNGEEPENGLETVDGLKGLFEGKRFIK